MRSVFRRHLLTGAGAALVGGADSASPTAGPLHRGGLHARALRKGLFYGTAIDSVALRADAALMTHVGTECGIITPETALTWAALRPRPDRFIYERADIMMAYAARHSLRVRGHALVWHRANPDWLAPSLTSQTGEKLLATHVHDVVTRFHHRVTHWDVVNEAIEPEDGNPLGLRSTPWYKALGPRYIDLAFQHCAAADPHALRVLNEYGLDYATPGQERRRNAVLELLADLRHRDVPVQALGLQAHLFAAEYRLDQKILGKFCDDVASLGLKIVITQMDIRDNDLPADFAARDAAVAAHGRAYLDVVLANQAVLGVVTWGLSDKHTWLDEQMPRLDHLPQRPLPLDVDMRRKPLWTSMAAAFDTTPIRKEVFLF